MALEAERGGSLFLLIQAEPPSGRRLSARLRLYLHSVAAPLWAGLIQALGCSIEFLQGTYANDRKAHLQIVATCIGSGVHGRLVSSGITF